MPPSRLKDVVLGRSNVRVSVTRTPTLLSSRMGKTRISVHEMTVGCGGLMQLQAHLLHIISQACSERLQQAQLYHQVMGSLTHLCIAADFFPYGLSMVVCGCASRSAAA